jgi:hypothetical protein
VSVGEFVLHDCCMTEAQLHKMLASKSMLGRLCLRPISVSVDVDVEGIDMKKLGQFIQNQR